ncbi:MAG: GldG family protein, partial [Planctomycetaceae bacterium]|nr:GldG family protein [Planctomycetaceae bacterium]
KFLAGVGILSASLLFSLVSNLTILRQLGNPDIGLFVSTYFGFLLVGVMMVSVGMVASFLTGNLTIAYLLGALFNAPFVAAQWAYALPVSSDLAAKIKTLSIDGEFDSFGRGIISFSGVMYFAAITAVMLYVSMVLISRRHWSANQAFHGWFHYFTRGISLLIIAISLSVIAQRFDFRIDMTQEKLSTLSPETTRLLDGIDPKYPVSIEAFISPKVPDTYIKTQLDLLSVLREVEKRGKGNVTVRINKIEPNTKDAMLADQRFGITPKTVANLKQGILQPERIFMGVVLSSGLNTVKLPFLERGLSVEYELVRAVSNVTAQQKKKIGILKTDAQLMGEFDFMTMSPPTPWEIIEDLKQQYVVTEIDPKLPVAEKFDAVVAVQPSTLPPNEMTNFINMVRSGQPTLIFEDPVPFFNPRLTGTADPKLPGGASQMAIYNPPQPKGNIEPLWEMLGLDFNTKRIPRSEYNPIKRFAELPPEFLFLTYNRSKPEEFRPFSSSDPTTKLLQHVLIPFAGSIEIPEKPVLKISPLIWTTRADGYVERQDIFPGGRIGFGSRMMSPDENRPIHKDPNQFDLAVRVEGKLPAGVLPAALPPNPDNSNANDKPQANTPATRISVILVADVDMISPVFYAIRKQGTDPRLGTNFDFDNVTFVLNAIDSLAGDTRFLAIRGRRPMHRALDKFDEMTKQINDDATTQREIAQQKLKETIDNATVEAHASVEKLSQELQKDQDRITSTELYSRVQAVEMTVNKKLEARIDELNRSFEAQATALEVERQEQLRHFQGIIKALAITVPPAPLLLLAFFVFLYRRMKETEGVSQSRLRKGK